MQAGDRVALACADLDDDGAGVGDARRHRAARPGRAAGRAGRGDAWPTCRLTRPRRGAAWSGSPQRRPIAESRSAPASGAAAAARSSTSGMRRSWRGSAAGSSVHSLRRRRCATSPSQATVASPCVLGYRNNAKLVAARRRGGDPGRLRPAHARGRRPARLPRRGARPGRGRDGAARDAGRAGRRDLRRAQADRPAPLRRPAVESRGSGAVHADRRTAAAERTRAGGPLARRARRGGRRRRARKSDARQRHLRGRQPGRRPHVVRRAGAGGSLDCRGPDDPDPVDRGRVLPGEPGGGGPRVRGADSGAGPAADRTGG